MNNYQNLLETTKEGKNYLMNSPIFEKLKIGDLTVEQYSNFLKEAFHHVKETVPLLMAVGAILPYEKEKYREIVIEYINEEYGHHNWILNDIENSGVLNKKEVESSLPLPETQAMISYVRDEIRKNPMSFFGMVLVLEGTSVEVATQSGELIMKHLGLSKKSFSYLFSHGSLDQEHIVFFENLINGIEEEKDMEDIIRVANYVYTYYSNILRKVFE